MTRAEYQPFPSFPAFAASTVPALSLQPLHEQLDVARAAAPEEQLDRVVRELTNQAAIDTGALEGLYPVERGFTVTMSRALHLVDAVREARDDRTADLVASALAAYGQVLDLATGRRPLSVAVIRDLNAAMVEAQDTYEVWTAAGRQERALVPGAFKTEVNNPSRPGQGVVHTYAPVDDVLPELQRLVDEVGSAEFQAAPPDLQTAYLHYAFVLVHPFPDGNGRVSRALASVCTTRWSGLPFVIYADERIRYLDALEASDAGRQQQFVSFVADVIAGNLQLATSMLSTPDALDDAARQLRAAGGRRPPPPGPPRYVQAARLLDAANQAMSAAVDRLTAGSDVEARAVVVLGSSHRVADPSFLPMDPPRHGRYELVLPGPYGVSAEVTVEVLLSPDPGAVQGLRVAALDGDRPTGHLDVRAEDVDPLRTTTRERLRLWAAKALADTVSSLAARRALAESDWRPALG